MATIQDDMTRHRVVPNRAFITLTADISLMLLSTTFIATRLYGRKFVSKTLGLDDGAAFISLVSGFKYPYVSLWSLLPDSNRAFSSQLRHLNFRVSFP